MSVFFAAEGRAWMYLLAHLLDKTSVSIISLSHGPFQ